MDELKRAMEEGGRPDEVPATEIVVLHDPDETAPNVQDFGVAEDRNALLEGYTVNFVTIRQDSDLAPMMIGAPIRIGASSSRGS